MPHIQGIDAHIHLDMYSREAAESMLQGLADHGVQALVAVSMHLDSCLATSRLRQRYPEQLYAAYGYHPEQPLLGSEELNKLLDWMELHAHSMCAIGEIGLPYYMRKEAEEQGRPFQLEPYIQLLEPFLMLAGRLDKPVVLHAVYEDAALVCDLLEKHRIRKAHFHWFKGPAETVRRMDEAGYLISVTPDIVYEPEIQELAASYSLDRLMVETDGPWPFEGPFAGKPTHPSMIHAAIAEIARLHRRPIEETAARLLDNTKRFYNIR